MLKTPFTLLIPALILSVPVFSAVTNNTPTGNSSLSKASAPTQQIPIAPNNSLCPDISSLVKNKEKMAWSAPGGYRGKKKSFVATIKAFEGVQWEGLNLGSIICLYSGKSDMTFDVQLLLNTSVYTPHKGKWVSKKGHYSVCISSNPKECPFIKQKKEKNKDINKVAQNIKKETISNPYELDYNNNMDN